MNVGTKIGGFLVGLVVVGVVGAGVGTVAGPIDTAPADHAGSTEHGDDGAAAHDGPTTSAADGHEGHADGEADGADEATAEAAAGGTSATQAGYRLALVPDAAEIRFQVLDPDGAPVVDTVVLHERPLHLIVVGRDLVGYAHLHPEVAADGTWSVARPDLAPGSYRVVADLQPVDGPELVLAADLTVPGPVAEAAVPEPSTTATVGDLTVSLDGTPAVGDVALAFAVRRGDELIEPEPYLGARGHLVAVRAADLAYLHVHPHDGATGPVEFTASLVTPGTYRLFLDLQVEGEVRTFAFTLEVDGHEH